jgi:hypothetical protein
MALRESRQAERREDSVMRCTLIVVAMVLLACCWVAGASAATIEVSGATYLTDNGKYDRNPFVYHGGSNYWLFYTKGDRAEPAVRAVDSYSPDDDAYTIYYKTAGSISGLAGAPEVLVPPSVSRPTGFLQRCTAGFVDGSGNMRVIASSGTAGLNLSFYSYYYNAGTFTWSGPTQIVPTSGTISGGHVHACYDGTTIFMVWEASGAISQISTSTDFGATWSTPVTVSTDNQPKITKMGSSLYVVGIDDGGTNNIRVHKSTDGGANWGFDSNAIVGLGLYDPSIFNDGTTLYVVTAPWNSGPDQQYLVQTKNSGAGWSPAKKVTLGGYGSTYWWDYWPCGYCDGADPYVFYTTETGSPTYSDGEIAMLKMDWDLGNDHYPYIQNGVDQAIADDVIHVAPGTYEEQVEINKALTLDGAGVGSTIIQSPPTLTKHFTTAGPNNNYPVVYVHGATGVVIQDLTVDGLSRGNLNYRFQGIAFWNAGVSSLPSLATAP